MYFWCTQQRSDTRCLSNTRLLCQALMHPEVVDLPQRLSAGLLVPMQDWAFLHKFLVLDRPYKSKSRGQKDILHGNPCLEHSQSRSFNSLIKSILKLLASPFFNACSLNVFQIESACSSSSSCCAAFLIWGKGLVHLGGAALKTLNCWASMFGGGGGVVNCKWYFLLGKVSIMSTYGKN